MYNDDLDFQGSQQLYLPQTKDEYREFQKMAKYKKKLTTTSANNDLNITEQTNSEPNIAPIVENLLCKNLSKDTVKDQIVNFFRAFDEHKEDQINRMQTQLDQQK